MEVSLLEFDLQHHGDYLEKQEFSFIRSHLPAYEEIWKRYIGHDGKGRMPRVNNLSAEMEEKRSHFGEQMYTCLESVICLRFLSEESENLMIVASYANYIRFLNLFLCFQAHAGRVKDNAEKIVNLMISAQGERDRLNNILGDYYEQRNNVLHGRKIPFAVYEKAFLIPRPAGKEISFKGWQSSNMRWDDLPLEDYVFFGDYLRESFLGITTNLNQILNNLIEPIKNLVRELGISLSPVSYIYDDQTPSGSQIAFPFQEPFDDKPLPWPSGHTNYGLGDL